MTNRNFSCKSLHSLSKLSAAMEAGTTVALHGLRARSDLNGRTGVLIQWLEVGRWVVEMDDTMEAVRVKPENITLLAAPLNIRSVTIEPAQLKAQFMAIVQRYGFDRGAKSDEVAEYMTSRETSATITCAAFSDRFGTSEEEADAFLAWLNVGIAFKERYIAQQSSDAPSLRTTPSQSASEDSHAADATVALHAAASRAPSGTPPRAGAGLHNSFAAVSLVDDYIAE